MDLFTPLHEETKTAYVNGEDLVYTDHFLERLNERNIPLGPILATIKSAGMNKKEQLSAIPVDSKVILRDPNDFGIAMQKYENTNGKIMWILITAHQTLFNPRGIKEIAIPRIIINPVLLKQK